ncbi:uncharacterized protein LOC115456200 isoform X2 [Manduca sexta]|uniref:uncharacterized protein LOC115456200 isoform X2 n=1 Tax=Manduca sexta TaxID=7130 RepID=UPI00188F5575|nr:uncharacterized protein LOC115456200 isoform X2 [Manduca sexta]
MYIKYYFIMVYVSCCTAERSGHSYVFLSVTVNGEFVKDGDGLKVKIPDQLNMKAENLTYTITGDAIYNESEVQCIMAVKGTTYTKENELTDEKRISMTLIMSSDRTSNDGQIREVSYNEDVPTPPCRRSEHVWPSVFPRKIINGNNFNVSELEKLSSKTPDNNTIIVFCDIIHFKYVTGTIQNFTREIRDKTKYVYKQKSFFSPTQTGIVMGIVIVAFIVVVAGIVLYRSKKNRAPDVTPSLDYDTNIYARPNQVIYAQLQLPEGTSVHRNSNATPYAQIIGFLTKK